MSLRVGVLMGGPSEEREVSISTGKAVSVACSQMGYLVEDFTFRNDYKKYLKQMHGQDIVFNALHGGIGENGKIQAWMDNNRIKYTGSSAMASSLCMDKVNSKDLAKKNGIDTPEWQLLLDLTDEIKLKTPFVVKPNDQGSTFGLSVVHNQEQIDSAVKKAFQYGSKVLIEKYIDGRELTVPVIGNRAYPIVEINPLHDIYDYECKYKPGMSEYDCPAKLNKNLVKKIKQNTMMLFKIFDCSVYARADFMLDNSGTPFFLEMNTLPGMTSTSLLPKSANAEGLSFNQLIEKIIKLSL